MYLKQLDRRLFHLKSKLYYTTVPIIFTLTLFNLKKHVRILHEPKVSTRTPYFNAYVDKCEHHEQHNIIQCCYTVGSKFLAG